MEIYLLYGLFAFVILIAIFSRKKPKSKKKKKKLCEINPCTIENTELFIGNIKEWNSTCNGELYLDKDDIGKSNYVIFGDEKKSKYKLGYMKQDVANRLSRKGIKIDNKKSKLVCFNVTIDDKKPTIEFYIEYEE